MKNRKIKKKELWFEISLPSFENNRVKMCLDTNFELNGQFVDILVRIKKIKQVILTREHACMFFDIQFFDSVVAKGYITEKVIDYIGLKERFVYDEKEDFFFPFEQGNRKPVEKEIFIESLEKELAICLNEEDYLQAAKLRDEIKSLKDAEA